jgi:hypothetical protein
MIEFFVVQMSGKIMALLPREKSHNFRHPVLYTLGLNKNPAIGGASMHFCAAITI